MVGPAPPGPGSRLDNHGSSERFSFVTGGSCRNPRTRTGGFLQCHFNPVPGPRHAVAGNLSR